MFTGIIRSVGRIDAVEPLGADSRFVIDAGGLPMSRVNIGDSIAVNGACLTVTTKTPQGFAADVSAETLSVTTLGDLGNGAPVNLEPALTLAEPLGGHLVSGHVDGVGRLVSRRKEGRSTRMEFELPAALGRYLAVKGSVCIDGVSLTINSVSGSRVGVNLVPHTLSATIMGQYEDDSRVNVEVDLVARYLERLHAG